MVLRARGGKSGSCGSENHYLFTEKLVGDPLFAEFSAKLRLKYEKSRQGKLSAGLDTSEEDNILKRLEEIGHGA